MHPRQPRKDRKEGGREGGAQSARCVAWRSRSWRQGAAYTNSKCFALGCNQTRATRPVRQSPVNQPQFILSGPSVRPSPLSLAPPAQVLSRSADRGFLFAAVKPSMSGFAETGGQQTFDWGRPLQPRCLLACCLRAEFKKTARNCLISQPCRGRSFVLGKQASSTAVHHHPASSSSSSSSSSLPPSLSLSVSA